MNVQKALLVLSLVAAQYVVTSCCKDEEQDGSTMEKTDATLIWTGDYALDGCGFMLQIGEVRHKPVNEADISSAYKTSSPTAVEATIINYNKKTRICMAGTEINSIKILDLQPL